jgi:hypothetical protein
MNLLLASTEGKETHTLLGSKGTAGPVIEVSPLKET